LISFASGERQQEKMASEPEHHSFWVRILARQ
jgi:hypothetical protein